MFYKHKSFLRTLLVSNLMTFKKYDEDIIGGSVSNSKFLKFKLIVLPRLKMDCFWRKFNPHQFGDRCTTNRSMKYWGCKIFQFLHVVSTLTQNHIFCPKIYRRLQIWKLLKITFLARKLLLFWLQKTGIIFKKKIRHVFGRKFEIWHSVFQMSKGGHKTAQWP